MTEPVGRTVRLFLVDGSPTGVVTAEIMNWTGHVLVAPRSQIGEALRREEADRTGVYCLVGDDPTQASKSLVYVGEADCVADRIKGSCPRREQRVLDACVFHHFEGHQLDESARALSREPSG